MARKKAPQIAEWIDEQVAPLMSGEALREDTSALSIEKKVLAYATLDHAYKKIEDRKKVLRQEILEYSEEYGTLDERGAYRLTLETGQVKNTQRRNKMQDATVREVLREHGVDPEIVFKKVVETQLDASALRALVDTGKLPEEAWDLCENTSRALKVIPDTRVQLALDESHNYYESPKPKKKAPARKKATKSTGKRKTKAAK